MQVFQRIVKRDLLGEIDPMDNLTDTQRWGIALLLAILTQTLGIVWFASGLVKQVEQNTAEISTLKSGATVYLTRQQLEDILGGRDQRLSNIEASVSRIETKIDKIVR